MVDYEPTGLPNCSYRPLISYAQLNSISLTLYHPLRSTLLFADFKAQDGAGNELIFNKSLN